MTTIKIDITDIKGGTGAADYVELAAPLDRGSAYIAGRVITTAPHRVHLNDGVATVTGVEPGPLMIRIACGNWRDDVATRVVVPDTDSVTLVDLLTDTFNYEPAIVSQAQAAARLCAESARIAREAAERAAAGVPGPQGSKGDPGPRGEQGVQGPRGESGPQGPKGDPGPQGVEGPQGIPGPRGERGLPGATGPRGVPGEKGADGKSIQVSGSVATVDDLPTLSSAETGQGYMTRDDGKLHVWDGGAWLPGIDIRGPEGPKGDTGEQGPEGPRGEVGPQGPAGLRGEQGEQGPRGVVGPEGKQGLVGPRGEKGPKGDTGAQGERGPEGPRGVMGPKGDTGPQGPVGPAGSNAWAEITGKPAEVVGLAVELAKRPPVLVVDELPTQPVEGTLYLVREGS